MTQHGMAGALRRWRLTLALLVAFGLQPPAHAQEAGPEFAVTFGISRDTADADDETGQTAGLATRLHAGFSVNYSRKTGRGTSDHYSFGLLREHYPGVAGAGRLRADVGYEHRRDAGARQQLRFRIEATVAHDTHEHVYSRIRGAAAWRMTFSPGNMLQSRLRIGWRDQNDSRFAGFDQKELLAELSWFWRDRAKRFSGLVTLYADRRFADSDVYSYSEHGLRLVGRRHFTEKAALVLRLSGFARDYRAGGREDRRLALTLGPEIAFGTGGTLELYAGYQDHASTLAGKDHSGAVAGIALGWTW